MGELAEMSTSTPGVAYHLSIVRQQLDEIARRISTTDSYSSLKSTIEQDSNAAQSRGIDASALRAAYVQSLLSKRSELQSLMMLKCLASSSSLQSSTAEDSCK